MFRAWERKDVAGILSCFACEEACALNGACSLEPPRPPRACRAELAEQLREAADLHVAFLRTRTRLHGVTARLVADCRFTGRARGRAFAVPARLVAVLQRREGRWLITRIR